MNSHDKSCVPRPPTPSPSRPAPQQGPREPLTSPSSLVSSWAQLREVLVPGEGDHRLGELAGRASLSEATVCTSVVLQTEGRP